MKPNKVRIDDFTDLDAILTDINVEWESSLDIMAPVSPGK